MHYVIGDLHGQLPALKELLKKIDYKPGEDYLYFLGDYTDWGPDSMGLIFFIMDLEKESDRVFPLFGNHDLMMRTCLHDPAIQEQTLNHTGSWARNRGDGTLAQYLSLTPEQQKQVLDWVDNLVIDMPVEVNDRKYWLAHGVPQCALRYYYEPSVDEAKILHDAVWYRIKPEDPMFDEVPELKGFTLIRGHSITPSRRVEIWDNHVISIDCGAKCFGITLEDEKGDMEEWLRDQDSALAAFCLEDESVAYVEWGRG